MSDDWDFAAKTQYERRIARLEASLAKRVSEGGGGQELASFAGSGSPPCEGTALKPGNSGEEIRQSQDASLLSTSALAVCPAFYRIDRRLAAQLQALLLSAMSPLRHPSGSAFLLGAAATAPLSASRASPRSSLSLTHRQCKGETETDTQGRGCRLSSEGAAGFVSVSGDAAAEALAEDGGAEFASAEKGAAVRGLDSRMARLAHLLSEVFPPLQSVLSPYGSLALPENSELVLWELQMRGAFAAAPSTAAIDAVEEEMLFGNAAIGGRRPLREAVGGGSSCWQRLSQLGLFHFENCQGGSCSLGIKNDGSLPPGVGGLSGRRVSFSQTGSGFSADQPSIEEGALGQSAGEASDFGGGALRIGQGLFWVMGSFVLLAPEVRSALLVASERALLRSSLRVKTFVFLSEFAVRRR